MEIIIFDVCEEYIKDSLSDAKDKDRERIEEYLSDINECLDELLIKDIKDVLKVKYLDYNCRMVFKRVFGTSDKRIVSEVVKKILEAERYNEYCKCVMGVTAPSYFGWYD